MRVPGTTANLGPGYDCLGVALAISNVTTLRRVPVPQVAVPQAPMVEEAAAAFFLAVGLEPFAFEHAIVGDVPPSRGLGSSVTVRLGVLLGLDALARTRLDSDDAFRICANLEGHPDNAAPALFGGFTVASAGGGVRVPVQRRLRFVFWVPAYEVSTPAARRVLPDKVPHADATRTVGAACRVTAAFATGEYDLLSDAFDDALHQPYRAKLVPGFEKVVSAGVDAGALGGFLSGSGSSIACVTLQSPEIVAQAMRKAGGGTGRVIVTHADNDGARVLARGQG